MAELKTCEVLASKVPEELANHLMRHGPAARPLALISDSHDQAAVAEGLKNSMGASIVQTRGLLAAADYDEKISLAALAYVNDDYRLAKTAASMRLLVQIYDHLKGSSFKNPLAVSIMFRDVLVEMDDERGTGELFDEETDPGCKKVDRAAYGKELDFVQALWDEFLKDRRAKRMKNLQEYADDISRNSSPIAYLHWGDEDKQIREFLEHASRQGADVRIYEAQLEGAAKQLCNLWRGDAENNPPQIKSKAYKGQTLEEAARASRRLLYSWLQEYGDGKGDTIGVLAYDLQLTRRLHSMLLQDGIHLQDTAGWPANNLLVGKALLALASGEKKAVELLRRTQNIAARKKLADGWGRIPRYLLKGDEQRQEWKKDWKELEDLEQKLQGFIDDSNKKHSVSEWFDLLAHQAESGIYQEFFTKDDAAHSLRKLLRMLADEFGADSAANYSSSEIRRLLFDSLASTSLVPSKNESAIQLVTPGRFTTRKFKAVLLAGADASNLPLARAPQLFNDNVRKNLLGLPLISQDIQKQRKSLALMLGRACEVGTVWHGETGISPYVEIMGGDKGGCLLKSMDHPWDSKDSDGSSSVPITEHFTALHDPIKEASVTACVKFMECPYQYYASEVLRLREDRSQNIGERKDKYGTFVHSILEKFHLKLKDIDKADHDKIDSKWLKAILKEVTGMEVCADKHKEVSKMTLEERRYFGWEFGHYVEPYVQKIKELYRCETFCHIKCAEVKLDSMLEDKGLTLNGKADRIDIHKDGAAIIDVKTGSSDKYKNYHEYPQLPLYMRLYEEKFSDAPEKERQASAKHTSFWTLHLSSGAIEIKKVDMSDDREVILNGINKFLDVFQKASPPQAARLPANGVHKVCQYCSYGGLCRKKHWRRDSSKSKTSSA